MSLSRKTMEHPILVLITFALLGILGAFTFSKIAIALMPDVDNPYVMIMTTYQNAGPESVEQTVTKVIENAVQCKRRKKNQLYFVGKLFYGSDGV